MIAPGSFSDGKLTSDAKGRVCRVFAPRWWAVWRWIEWLRCPADAKTIERRLTFDIEQRPDGVLSGRVVERRVRLLVVGERAS